MSELLKIFNDNKTWLESSISRTAGKKGGHGTLYFVGREESLPSTALKTVPSWLKEKIKNGASMLSWTSPKGPVWYLNAKILEMKSHYGYFSPSSFSMARDLAGGGFRSILGENLSSLQIEHFGSSDEELKGLCAGLEIAHYSFSSYWPVQNSLSIKISIKTKLKNSKELIREGALIGKSVNLSRFLVDMPPNELQPQSYSESIKKLFSKAFKTTVTIWDTKKLEKENMGLHLAVGQGALHGPSLVHIQYRNGGKSPAMAFVGKGITFDSGGLDIKPASGMRLMKKDMGGSATVAGLAYWVSQEKPEVNCDFYLALAENAVSRDSFRPGDIVKARNGKTVEIHNTDAEGRLVLADALTVACEAKPALVIDVATLTGAIKYGLGSNVPGLFANTDNLAETLLRSGQNAGDGAWRMPLTPEEKSRLNSEVADMVNCTDGFGGAVTAALFLESFIGNTPWAHLDIYAWNDRAKGAFRTSGGNGQAVQMLSQFIKNYQQ